MSDTLTKGHESPAYLTEKMAKITIKSDKTQPLSLALIGLGAIFVLAGPWLSGDAESLSQALSTWCQHGATNSPQGLWQALVQEASRHCAYCYLGAAMIGTGLATGLSKQG
ncbi:hypothetical protein PbB2_00711 [Candidatus Phycosocius bacilliformis]|uniref:Uncharacterized protein n=1 Tax=Candidatus Phycosocius bacilliformis TaxID=1445552 RepID=A0A2P2E7L1_9PROT|nr:hypothetical protein [Candidatus Phycosocius bacilliformis]GBF57052.1 hypothetical protein PbB2_00711 [Candidatus Phycosocius bacilliformis]